MWCSKNLINLQPGAQRGGAVRDAGRLLQRAATGIQGWSFVDHLFATDWVATFLPTFLSYNPVWARISMLTQHLAHLARHNRTGPRVIASRFDESARVAALPRATVQRN